MAVNLRTKNSIEAVPHLMALENTSQVIEAIENGLPISFFTFLRNQLGVADKVLADYIRIPKSTLATRKKAGKFTLTESERLYRIQRLFYKAVKVFSDQKAAQQWLKTDAFGLGDISPLEYAKTEPGAREVEDLLGRIEHGVFT
ncbi:MAG: DUF2384 domain-containing protein [Desulfobacteraceae bacterium]|nr:DUF2384 domain-containing protein [Desulfobacteraceae bacterium]